GVERNADLNHFKAAYHELLRHFHPDKFRQSSKELREEVEQVFQGINAAWNQVQDEWQRNSKASQEPLSPLSPQASASADAGHPGHAQVTEVDSGGGQESLPSDKLSKEALEKS